MHSHDPRRRKLSDEMESEGPNPMEEENFPDSPAREAADREMAEPTNVPGSKPMLPKRMPIQESEDE
ncbi:MAG TPA: hypothetical protein VM370_04595 [Candidatus Thermoplasmatota archaeon]|nr:hypothetical protein [Candidatus Thermoplasmatota archaeon]